VSDEKEGCAERPRLPPGRAGFPAANARSHASGDLPAMCLGRWCAPQRSGRRLE
jgi:hypothetical protein